MVAAGLAGVVARLIDAESIYEKKLSRRGESVARAHDAHRLEHVMVRDVMVRFFPTVRHSDNLAEIVRIARANSHVESLPVMDDRGQLVGIIRSVDLHRVLDTEMPAQLVNADDIAQRSLISVDPSENLLEALRDFGVSDVETLPVEEGTGEDRRLIGLLLRSDAMRRYREEMLRPR
jgi:CBS-domain-containing membrane protein